MKHVFLQGQKDQTFLLLHGTGGNEEDLIPLAKHLDHEANVLSVRGNILEHGMPRFFKRHAMGVFDMDSLAEETKKLYDFLIECAKTYSFDASKVIALGYSNGANIAINLMFSYENPFYKAILFHPMNPNKDANVLNLNGIDIFIGAGTNDPMVHTNDTKDLIMILENAKAQVKVHWTNQGHQLNKDEILAAKYWYDKVI